MYRELKADELKLNIDIKKFGVNSTKNIEPLKNIIGQDVAAEALKFGLNIKTKGFNIFMIGVPGTGKTTFAKKYAKEIAKTEPVPNDLCYVYNFENPKCPKLIKLKAGVGKEFKEEFEELIHVLSIEIPHAFSSEDFEGEKERIIKSYQDKRDEVIKRMTAEAKEFDFGVKMSSGGIYFLPIIDGKTITEEDFEDLTQEQKEEISKRSETVQLKASSVMREIKELERDAKKEMEEEEYNIGLFAVGHYFRPLQDKYADNDIISEYLGKVKEDILTNIEEFADDAGEEDENMQLMAPWLARRTVDDITEKYKVNLIVDNSKLEGAPVIIDYNPTYANLIGEVEYDNEYGNFTTDYMKIKPGILHKANGGYLILSVNDLLSNPYAWETLKRVIKTGKIIIEPLKEYQLGGISVTTIKPEPVDCHVKIILIGTSYYYELLNEADDDFLKFFRICPIFDYEMNADDKNIYQVAQFIKNYTMKDNTLDFDASGINEVIRYAARVSERRDKLTTRFCILNDILAEADSWARADNADIIKDIHVKKAISKKIERMGLYERKLDEMIMENEILIDTNGACIGQINGLAVMDMGEYSFGKPTRITATSYLGKAGIVNIEKEAEMSGSIHDKGIQVLTGYLGQTYAQEFPLSLSCRICFEQNYNGIDGDSASSTELYAVISSLSEIPLSQEIAVTGSINQKGEIQPIGGVTYKVEGFYNICKKRGLTGNQGVIIPEQNIKDLVLNEDVLDAINNGTFHIYPIKNINEGLEILTGKTAGKKSAKGKFSPTTIHGRVMKKLRDYHKKAMEDVD